MTGVELAAEPVIESSDRALVLAARQGDQAAFRALYERHAGPVLGLLRHLVFDRARADDALEDTFVKVFAALRQFDVERPFGPWVKEIARNVARDAPRPLEIASPGSAAGTDPAGALARREQEELVLATLVDLPERERTVLVLRYRKGLTQSDTAAEMKLSRRTVATLQKDALARLASLMRQRETEQRKESGL
jgi:RNA polymerase sigma-70 factor (ECF subfamily)